MEINKLNRIYGFDLLRFLMIVCVIMLHAAMTYMAYVPDWWYVIDANKSLYFTMLVVFLDAFPMSVLFFLSGYFSPISFNKYGRGKFIKSKFFRIFIPWLIGLIFVAPFFAYATFRAFKIPDYGFFYFIKNYFISFKYTDSFYQQGHYWFLNVLFTFFIVYAFVASAKTPNEDTKRPLAAWNKIFILIFILTALFYFLSSMFLMPPDNWFNILCLIYFQPARIISYIALFILGVKAYHNDWFNSGYKPNLFLFGILSLIFAIALLSRKFSPNLSFNANINLLLDAIFYSAFSISMTIFLTGFFAKIRKAPPVLLTKISRASYGIYWLHQIILMPLLWLMIPFNINIVIKWLAGVLLTIFIGWLINDLVFKKLNKFIP